MRKKVEVTPIGRRKLEFVFLREIKRGVAGVYILWFGERFYIGKANCIRRRTLDHKSKLNYTFGAFLYGRKTKYYGGSYETIISYLIENPEITTVEVDVLDICETEKEALFEESLWHGVLISHPLNHFCLNKLYYLPDYQILG